MPKMKDGNTRRAPLHSIVDFVGSVKQFPYVRNAHYRRTEERKIPQHLRMIHPRKARFFSCLRVVVSNSLDDPLQVR